MAGCWLQPSHNRLLMNFLINVKHHKNQGPQIAKMVKEFCDTLPDRVSITGCSFNEVSEVKKPKKPKKVKEVKDVK